MTSDNCQAYYGDNDLFYEALKSKAYNAWTCLHQCSNAFLSSVGKRLGNSRHLEDLDIMQDAQIRLYMKVVYENYFFLPERRAYPFCSVLRRMFVNLCTDTYRKHKKYFTSDELGEAEKMKTQLPNLLDEIIDKEKLKAIERSKSALLTPRQLEAFDCIVIEGLAYEETAERMGISVRAVTNLISLARNILREHFQN
ncbi:RNA polymerase sigma factor [Persicitalea jodogahamensis]|uniref:RNA polymerase sigma factor 70 region 4 type 2 domain-containing protein n=1 Tax=Persicitalea jodogahamensis TaxID=402147 RepID=A0A8J3D8K5_9BACT|nr:sigma-70 family RNA polymerase sigma factor [Persicitalea jodogahamensis]GHB88857.1 hypothetical protein GCM10007390_51200 [Persicitalea jodogahamensis]